MDLTEIEAALQARIDFMAKLDEAEWSEWLGVYQTIAQIRQARALETIARCLEAAAMKELVDTGGLKQPKAADELPPPVSGRNPKEETPPKREVKLIMKQGQAGFTLPEHTTQELLEKAAALQAAFGQPADVYLSGTMIDVATDVELVLKREYALAIHGDGDVWHLPEKQLHVKPAHDGYFEKARVLLMYPK